MAELFWPLITLAALALLFLIVPPARIRELLLFGYAGGFLLAAVQNYALVHLLELWHYHHLFIAVGGVPLAILLLWWAITIFFGHVLLETGINRVLLFILFAAGAAAFWQFLVWSGYHSVVNWSFVHTFFQGIISHAVLYVFFLFMVPSKVKNLH